MRQKDITDPIDVINFKISWYQHIASYLVNHHKPEALLSLLAGVRAGKTTPTEIAVKFLPVLGAEHSVYSGLIGHFICKYAMERLDLYDDRFRLAPEKQEMGRIEDVILFYHSDTREYEVSDGTIGVRFPALYVPTFGIDVLDEETAADMAMAILNYKKTKSLPFEFAVRFPLVKLGARISEEKKSPEFTQTSGKIRRY